MTHRTNLHHLDDMIDAGERALRHSGDLTREQIEADELRSDAIVRTLEVFGEAAKRLPGDIQTRFPNVPWKSIARMRDNLIHHYHSVDWRVVYDALTVHIPASLTELRVVLATLEAEEPPPPAEAP